MTSVVICGQRSFGRAVFNDLHGDADIAAVVSPAVDDRGRPDRLTAAATGSGVPWIDADQFSPTDVPDCDVLVAAHSHAYIGRRTRARAHVAVGYHPSLLPRHRGRDAVRWTIHMGDPVTGGTVYHLTDTVDGGPIAAQQHVLIPPGCTVAELWHDLLFPLGVSLLRRVVRDAAAGCVARVPQDTRCATWEPSWERAPLHRPELFELAAVGHVPKITFRDTL